MASSNKSSIYIYDGSVIPIFSMLLFGGDYIYDSPRGQAIVCGWIKIKINELNVAICKRLQLEIFDILKVYLEGNIQVNELTERQNILIDAIVLLLS